jgi:hypothetical protein
MRTIYFEKSIPKILLCKDKRSGAVKVVLEFREAFM